MNQFLNELASFKAIRIAAVVAISLLALFLLVKTWDMAFGRDSSDPFNTITVEGTGRAAVIPDVARLVFTVTESAATVADAQKAATDKINSALDSVKGQNIDDKDVKTLSYQVNPKYEYAQPCYAGAVCPPTGSPRIVGYEVSQTIEVKVRDTAKAGDVLQSLGSIGVQNISGPDFVVDDESEVANKAREEAIKEAREKAKQLAKELGVSLGDIVSFYESNGPGPMYAEYGKGGAVSDMRAPVAAPTLPVGEQETNVTVSITYEIR